MKASVIIASYNGAHYLEKCLASLRSALGGVEIILVDNGSSDGTVEFVRSHYPGVRLMCNPNNRGFALACNQGAALARGEVLVFLNQDTRVAPGWLQPLVAALDLPGIGLTTSRVLLMSAPGLIHLCGQDVHYTGLVFSRDFGEPAADFSAPQQVGAVSGAAFAIRRELWEALGGFDPTFYMYYEETDLCWRAQLAGYHCYFVPESVVYHDYTPGEASGSCLYHTMRNRPLMLLKNWGGFSLFLLSPALLLAEAVEFALALRRGRAGLRAKLRACCGVARNLPGTLRQRKQAQTLRRVQDSTILRLRSYQLTPVETPLSPFFQSLLAPLNAFFRFYHQAAINILRSFRL